MMFICIYFIANTFEWIRLIKTLLEIDRANSEATLAALERFSTQQPVTYKTGSGTTFTHSVQEIFFQIITHSTYHRGQIATELRSIGIQPPMTDFIYYKMISGT